MIEKMLGGFITIIEMPKGESKIIKREKQEKYKQTYEEYVKERLKVEKLLK
jgi:hypothetical protein